MKKSISPYSVAEKAIDRKRKGLSGGWHDRDPHLFKISGRKILIKRRERLNYYGNPVYRATDLDTGVGRSGGRPSTAAGDLLKHLNKSKVTHS